MATYKFEIDKRLMGLNEYTKANRTNKYAGNQAKKDEQKYIEWCIIEQLGNLHINKPVKGRFTWIEENKRRDLDNMMKVLKDDNRKIVTSFVDEFKYADKSKVIVELEEI